MEIYGELNKDTPAGKGRFLITSLEYRNFLTLFCFMLFRAGVRHGLNDLNI